MSKEQVGALLAAARGERNEALYVVAVHTGLGQGELLGLKWTDVRLGRSRGELAVRRSLKATEDGLGFGPPKNRASQVQPLLGHVSIVQTMDTYSHLLEDIGGDAVRGLDEAFC